MPNSKIRFLPSSDRRDDCPLFVFLPGMDGTGKLLHRQIPHLKPAFDIRCLSIPHYDDFSNWYSLAHQTIHSIETELKGRSNRSVYLCGESFGGCLALQVALHAPQLVERLILINPASSFNQRPWMSWGTPLIRWFPEPFYQLSALGLLPFLAASERVSAPDRQKLLEAMQSVSPQAASWRLSLLRGFEISSTQMRQLHHRVLVLASALDRLLPSVSEAQRLVKLLPHANMLVLPNSGHACSIERDINLYQILQQGKFLPELSYLN